MTMPAFRWAKSMPAESAIKQSQSVRVGHIHGDGGAADLVGDGARSLLAHIDYENVRAEHRSGVAPCAAPIPDAAPVTMAVLPRKVSLTAGIPLFFSCCG